MHSAPISARWLENLGVAAPAANISELRKLDYRHLDARI